MTTPRISAYWVAWEGGLNIDADGAPNAYAPGNKGLDYTANAGSDGNWYGILTDKDGDPVVQGPDDPCPGGFIATTSLQDPTKAVDDPRRYVDSTAVPYLSIPKNAVAELGIHVGDVGFAYCRKTGQMCPAVVADVGPKNKYGEGSIALARALDLPTSPRNGGAASGVVCVVFKGTRRGWPRANADVAQQVEDRINELGGVSVYQALIAPQS
jgi:hypothetical protein